MSKKESYPPLEMLKSISKEYPKIWELMEEFHQEKGTNELPSWPEWCYMPMNIVIGIATKGYEFDSLTEAGQREALSLAQEIFALAPWRLGKEVYVIDPDLKELLFEQNGELDVPDEIFLQLPYQSFYVEVPDLYFGKRKIHGFFVTLDYDQNNGNKELRVTFVYENLDVLSFPFCIGCKTVAESVDKTDKQCLSEEELKGRTLNDILCLQRLKVFLKQILQIILYILAQNAEITPNSEQVTITKRGKMVKDKYSEIRKWDVGVRIGSAVRQQKAKEQLADEECQEGGSHQSPRPHMRRGHWHHFWTGPKSKPEERKLILKWLSPMAVAVTQEDTPVVLHNVR